MRQRIENGIKIIQRQVTGKKKVPEMKENLNIQIGREK